VGATPEEAPKHRGDLAFLCGLVADPRALAADLTSAERGWLRDRKELADAAHATWWSARRPEDAYLAFMIMARPREARR
jgi:hypothetical protein